MFPYCGGTGRQEGVTMRVTFVSFVPWESWEASSRKTYRKKKENDVPFTQLQRQPEANGPATEAT